MSRFYCFKESLLKTTEIGRGLRKKEREREREIERERERKSQREVIEKEGEGKIEKVRDRHDRKR